MKTTSPINRIIKSKHAALFLAGSMITVILLGLGFMYFMRTNNPFGTVGEQYVSGFVQRSIIEDAPPAIRWVNNQTKSDPDFSSELEDIRQSVRSGGYTQASVYQDRILITSSRYNFNDAQFYAAQICKPNSEICVYVAAYVYDATRKYSISSLQLFESKDEIDVEIRELRQ